MELFKAIYRCKTYNPSRAHTQNFDKDPNLKTKQDSRKISDTSLLQLCH
ncbi:39389_t:CDS:2 [Gigaspora margarita]|uniref:39389_t:CDS:1 n=1 Tax=Gigaspora margarita TaxID=4874 RepID=A0ABN7UBS6_GIGMA|nr:39389_t:CDS:2 [Gigaspora margarita]